MGPINIRDLLTMIYLQPLRNKARIVNQVISQFLNLWKEFAFVTNLQLRNGDISAKYAVPNKDI